MDDFDRIRSEMESFDEARETVIKESRALLKASKQAIYALHRDDRQEAQRLLDEARAVKERLEHEYIAANPNLRTGGFSGACEEYVEALAFFRYIVDGKLLALAEAGVSPEEYLGGLADLTGELGRRAVILATARDIAGVQAIRNFTDVLFGQFVRFDFRNGELRRKYDAMKYNLQKMEQLLYELARDA